MYLAGTQYAGIIIPRLALNIIDHNRNPQTSAWLRINLNGIYLQNPCTLGDECDSHFQFTSYTVKYLKNHYFLSKEQYDQYWTYCALETSECERVKQKIEANFLLTGADLNNLYKQCLSQPGEYRCLDHIGIDTFLNTPIVKQDLHANSNIKWQFCNSDIARKIVRDPYGSLKIYETLLREEHNLRIVFLLLIQWIVSGVLSAQVPVIGTKKWI